MPQPRPPTPGERSPMVRWFDPGPLVVTGVQVLVSTLFGRHSDYRLVEALASPGTADVFDYTRDEHGTPRTELWLDYLADTGDGFDSTYAIAHALTRPQLGARATDGQPCATRPGDVLVFGGDQVYPTASRGEYQQRLALPFRTARRAASGSTPDVFAIPGNHDWYDSLVAFTRLFCSERAFQSWRTRQRRSYFALRLPHGWWLMGTDVQLDSDIDRLQVDYFKAVAEQITPGDRVILCTAEPHWVYAALYESLDPEWNQGNLEYLERVFERQGAKVALHLAGDLHHYRRHAAPDGSQKITSGGGGAFLHPTHGDEDTVAELPGGFRLAAAFPDPATSRRLCWRNLAFPILNPGFGVFAGSAYALLGWWMQTGGLGRLLGPLVLVATLILFTDTHSAWYRRVAGTLHGFAHVACAYGLLHLGQSLADRFGPAGLLRELPTALMLFYGGALAGSLIMGVYLLLSLNVFGRHANEAFSALRIPDFKNFLRLWIDPRGDLLVYPIGIRRVPRRWRAVPDAAANEPLLEPDDPRAAAPAAIEPAIRIPGRAAASQSGGAIVSSDAASKTRNRL